jgi:hypothetical protein
VDADRELWEFRGGSEVQGWRSDRSTAGDRRGEIAVSLAKSSELLEFDEFLKTRKRKVILVKSGKSIVE